MANDKKTRDKIREMHALAVGWAAFSHRAADDGHMMDAAQHLRRANECALKARQLEQKLPAD